MIRPGTVLLLGAGASWPYGYPTGGELRKRIILEGESIITELEPRAAVQARRFVEDFRDSALYSIDSFLEKRKELGLLGKQCIAKVLLQCEEGSDGHARHPEEDWYADLWNRVATPQFADLDLSVFSVVTFNYDRSLELFLVRAIVSTYGVAMPLAMEKLRSFRIVHVYGSLADPFDFQPNYMPPGREPQLRARANGLRAPSDHSGRQA